MSTKVTLGCWILFLTIAPSSAAHAAEHLVLYDNFQTSRINPNKWYGSEFGGAVREAFRGLAGDPLVPGNRRLRLENRSYGDTTSDTGARFGGFRLNFFNPSAVTAIQAIVEVKSFQATRCSTPGSAVTRARALLAGYFFNTGTPTPGSGVNDVWAGIMIQRRSDSTDPSNTLRVISAVALCTDASCLTSTTLDSTDLGPVTKGQRVKLRIEWDQANHRFIFQKDAEPEVFSPYAVSDTAPPGLNNKRLDVAHWVANCTATPRPVAFMQALFDDVSIAEVYGYPYYGASLFGPIRPAYAFASLGLVLALALSQLALRPPKE